MPTVETTEDFENSYRFKMGRNHGAADKDIEVESDLEYLKLEKPTTQMDDAYLAGYERGYLEGPRKKKR